MSARWILRSLIPNTIGVILLVILVNSVNDMDNLTRHEQDCYLNSNRGPKMWKYEVEEALDFLNIKSPNGDFEEFNI